MTNDTIRTVVITGESAVRASTREKRNITPFSGRMPSFVIFILRSPRGHYANILSSLVVDAPKYVSLLKPTYTLPLPCLKGPHLRLQGLHLRVQLREPLLDAAKPMNLRTEGFVSYACQRIVDVRRVRVIKAERREVIGAETRYGGNV